MFCCVPLLVLSNGAALTLMDMTAFTSLGHSRIPGSCANSMCIFIRGTGPSSYWFCVLVREGLGKVVYDSIWEKNSYQIQTTPNQMPPPRPASLKSYYAGGMAGSRGRQCQRPWPGHPVQDTR